MSERSNIQVMCRFRPQNSLEKSVDGKESIQIKDDWTCVINTKQAGTCTFSFDHIFNQNCTQQEVYENVGKPVVEDIFNGYNGTIFVYGQTGSGKTHTMMGGEGEAVRGITPRVVEDIFKNVEASDDMTVFEIAVQYIEIYMEKLNDLLDPSRNSLSIKDDQRVKGIYVEGASEEFVVSPEEVFQLMAEGLSNRVISSTRMNSESSRSHSIFIITVTQRHIIKKSSKTGKLFLVDLAGSEKVKKTGATGKLLEEAKTINKSLSALGMVINALTDGKSTHIPYRDSKLTRLLQDSLGGNSRTTLVINCSPSSYNEEETLSTLRFGTRAKTIKNKPKINQDLSAAELKIMLDQAKARIVILEAEIHAYKGSSKTCVSEADGSSVQNSSNLLPEEISSRIVELEKMLDHEKIEKEELQSKNDAYEEEYTQIAYENAKFKEEILRITQMSETLNTRLREKKTEIEYLIELNHTLSKDLSDANEEILRLRTHSEKLKAERIEIPFKIEKKDYIDENNSNQGKPDPETPIYAQVDNSESLRTELEREFKECEKDIGKWIEQENMLKQALTEMVERNVELEVTISHLRIEIANFNRTEELDKLKMQVKSLEKELKEKDINFNDYVLKSSTQISDYMNQSQELEKYISRMKNEIKELKQSKMRRKLTLGPNHLMPPVEMQQHLMKAQLQKVVRPLRGGIKVTETQPNKFSLRKLSNFFTSTNDDIDVLDFQESEENDKVGQ